MLSVLAAVNSKEPDKIKLVLSSLVIITLPVVVYDDLYECTRGKTGMYSVYEAILFESERRYSPSPLKLDNSTLIVFFGKLLLHLAFIDAIAIALTDTPPYYEGLPNRPSSLHG